MANKVGPPPTRPSPIALPHTYWTPNPTPAAGPSRPLPWGTPSPGCLPHPLSDVFRFTSDVAPAASAPPFEPIEPRFRSSGNTLAAAAAIAAATRDGGGLLGMEEARAMAAKYGVAWAVGGADADVDADAEPDVPELNVGGGWGRAPGGTPLPGMSAAATPVVAGGNWLRSGRVSLG